jgi:methionyl-tRNA formyltransferase
MDTHQNNGNRPLRVVVFGGGPVLERGIKQFICRLEEHPDIAFLGAFCQSKRQNFRAVVRDLWRRRRLLALPLLLAHMGGTVSRFLAQPRTEVALHRKLAQLSDRLHFVPDVHAEEVLTQIRALAPELGLIYGSPVLKPKLFEIPTLGTLGIHHGKLPGYRGKKTTFWAMYNGEKTAGVTIQKVNAGLDTGEIVKQGEVPIGCRSLRVVWRELNALGLDLYIQSIVELQQGMVRNRSQEGQKGKLYRDPRLGDILTLWWRQVNRRVSHHMQLRQANGRQSRQCL